MVFDRPVGTVRHSDGGGCVDGRESTSGKVLPEGRQIFLKVLNKVAAAVAADSQVELVRLLKVAGCPVNRGALSRYLRGERNPGRSFVEGLYRLAVQRAGSADAVGLTWQEVVEAHGRVEFYKKAKCSNCEFLEGEVAGLRAALDEPKAGSRRGATAAGSASASPPVPPRRGDRRREDSDVRAAERFAATAVELEGGGRSSEAVAAMSDAVGFLTPVEAAVAFASLEAGRHERLADSLGQMYVREREGRSIIRMALELHDRGMPEEATEILRWAAAVDGMG
ncbi:hypothetical protein ACFWP3_34025 [Streptomyces sp. NPDC058525]|uniref:hypothetical protein n=1 Tax=Streptomyces sp. NPDC058525 TaxID=3346538 RepID=UPI003650BA7A